MMARGRFLEGTKGHIIKVRFQMEPVLTALTHRGLVPSLTVGESGETGHCYQRLGLGSCVNLS